MQRTLGPVLWILVLTLAFAACGDDDDDGPAAPAAFDLTGTWVMQETIDATACGEGTDTDSWTMTVVQEGNDVTIDTPDGQFSGTVSGDRVSWRGSYSYDGGTLTITSMVIRVVNDGDGLNGTVQWSWTDGSLSCSGSTLVSGTRTGA